MFSSMHPVDQRNRSGHRRGTPQDAGRGDQDHRTAGRTRGCRAGGTRWSQSRERRGTGPDRAGATGSRRRLAGLVASSRPPGSPDPPQAPGGPRGVHAEDRPLRIHGSLDAREAGEWGGGPSTTYGVPNELCPVFYSGIPHVDTRNCYVGAGHSKKASPIGLIHKAEGVLRCAA